MIYGICTFCGHQIKSLHGFTSVMNLFYHLKNILSSKFLYAGPFPQSVPTFAAGAVASIHSADAD